VTSNGLVYSEQDGWNSFFTTSVTSVHSSQGDGSKMLTNYFYISLVRKLRIRGLVHFALSELFITWGLGMGLNDLLLICVYNNEHGDR